MEPGSGRDAIGALVALSRRITVATSAATVAAALADALENAVAPQAIAVQLTDAAGTPRVVERRGGSRELPGGTPERVGRASPHVREIILSGRRGHLGRVSIAWAEEPTDLDVRWADALSEVATSAIDRLDRPDSVRQLAQMAGALAHEIKNPLASIGGVLQVLRNGAAPDSADGEVLGKVLDRLGDLNRLVDDLVQFARQPPPLKSLVRVDQLLHDASDAYRREGSAPEVAVTVQAEPVELELDRARMHRGLVGLLHNAGHAMKGQGTIRVRLVPAPDSLEIHVDDEGTGIPMDRREEDFEPFFTTKVRGSGLGLALARQVVESHGGAIEVADAPGGGARFRLRFPIG
jgi:signal transduction histidine kinase